MSAAVMSMTPAVRPARRITARAGGGGPAAIAAGAEELMVSESTAARGGGRPESASGAETAGLPFPPFCRPARPPFRLTPLPPIRQIGSKIGHAGCPGVKRGRLTSRSNGLTYALRLALLWSECYPVTPTGV